MIKILYIISTLKKTGPVNVLYNIIKNLDRTQFEPIIFTLSAEPKGSIKNEFEALNVECQCLNLKGFNGYIKSAKIIKIVKDISPDIIHSHCFRSTLFTALYLNNYKTISTIHCDYDEDYAMSYGKFIGQIMCKLTDLALNRLDKRICVSELLSKILLKKKKFKFAYVNNGIDTTKFIPATDKYELKKKLNLPTDKQIFIWVGCLVNRKNPLLFSKLITQLNNSKNFYIFCGDGNLKNNLKEELKYVSNVIFTGNIDNIEEYLQASDYYISTSLSEGLPMSVLEGMDCGLPVILSNISQHKMIFKKDIGFTFVTDNSNDLASKVKTILNKDYSELSTNAISTIKEYFNAKIMSNKYMNIYKELY